jgi:aspartyl-tRNA(Asn)/glutamyl-tRNA(Gln) amidotransferase subunit C
MITKDEVEHVGWLARIEIDEQDADSYAAQLNSVLDYFGQLDEVDTDNVDPTYHVADVVNVFREDVVTESLTQEEALENTQSKQDGHFKAPKGISKVRKSIAATSSEEVTASYLKIIKKSKINGYVTINEGAITRAQEIDKNDLN